MPLRRLVVLAALAGALAFVGALLRPRPRPAAGAASGGAAPRAAGPSVPRPAEDRPATLDVRDAGLPVPADHRAEPVA